MTQRAITDIEENTLSFARAVARDGGNGLPSWVDESACVQEQTFFANNEAGVQLAEAIVDAVACAEKVRFLSSGSEATFYAMRWPSWRQRRLKFEAVFMA